MAEGCSGVKNAVVELYQNYDYCIVNKEFKKKMSLLSLKKNEKEIQLQTHNQGSNERQQDNERRFTKDIHLVEDPSKHQEVRNGTQLENEPTTTIDHSKVKNYVKLTEPQN